LADFTVSLSNSSCGFDGSNKVHHDMSTPLFSDAMEIESMFPQAQFSKSSEVAEFLEASGRTTESSDSADAERRGRAENRDSVHSINNLAPLPYATKNAAAASFMSQYTFTPINLDKLDVSVSLPYQTSLSMDPSAMSASATCFPPLATLMSPEEMPTPQFDFGSWDSPAPEDVKHMMQDGHRDSQVQSLVEFRQPSFSPGIQYQRRHGQLTPPDDQSPKSHSTPYPNGDTDGADNKHRNKERSSTGKSNGSSASTGSKRRSGAKASHANPAVSDPAPKRSRKSRRVSKSASSVGTDNPQEEVKRERFLERNLVAASKCRQKKKEWTSQLEEDERQQKALHMYLKRSVAQLKEELLFLKGECLKHSDCECEAIRNHMASTIPMMQRPSQTLYNQYGPFNSVDGSRPSVSSLYDDVSSDSGRRASSMSDSMSIDDDMRELLNANLLQDASE